MTDDRLLKLTCQKDNQLVHFQGGPSQVFLISKYEFSLRSLTERR